MKADHRVWSVFIFALLGLEKAAVQSGLPVDVRDRSRPRRVVRAASRVPGIRPYIAVALVLLPLWASPSDSFATQTVAVSLRAGRIVAHCRA